MDDDTKRGGVLVPLVNVKEALNSVGISRACYLPYTRKGTSNSPKDMTIFVSKCESGKSKCVAGSDNVSSCLLQENMLSCAERSLRDLRVPMSSFLVTDVVLVREGGEVSAVLMATVTSREALKEGMKTMRSIKADKVLCGKERIDGVLQLALRQLFPL